MNPEDREALTAHMAVCEACRRDCREGREAIILLRKHWRISTDTLALLGQARPGRVPVRSAWAGWGLRAGAVAACLVAGALGWWGILGRRIPATCPQGPVVSSAGEGLAAIDPAGDGARLAPRTTIETSDGETESLVLGGRHRLVVNAGTRLSIEPLVESNRSGCLVRLAFGEVCAAVEHDGSPFVVQTAHGRAIITGTTFAVQATATTTTLVVVEGRVRFESLKGLPSGSAGENGAVQVVAGQQSTIAAAGRPPSLPRACDVRALTAWVQAGRRTFRASPGVPAGDWSVHELPLPVLPWVEVQTDPDQIDYAVRVEHKRNWFKQQFPWIFALQEALIAEGCEPPGGVPDYPVLLVQSGDIWRFAYPRAAARRQLGPDRNGLLRAAAWYGRDAAWLERRLRVALPAMDRGPQTTGAAAFERWIQAVEADANARRREVDSQVLQETLEACTYLIETRTLALLLLRRKPENVAPSVKREVLGLLREELQILACCARLSYELTLGGWPNVGSCECPDRTGALLQELRRLAETEKQVTKHEGILGS